MNQKIIVLLFIIFIFCLSQKKFENFGNQMILPDYTVSIFTGRNDIPRQKTIYKKSKKRIPTLIQSLPNPPYYSEFNPNNIEEINLNNVGITPTEIREIDNRLLRINEKLEKLILDKKLILDNNDT